MKSYNNKYITKKAWNEYVRTLSAIDNKAAANIKKWIKQNVYDAGLENILDAVDGFDRSFIDYCYSVAKSYGDASASVAAQMYDAIAEMENKIVPYAEIVNNTEYGDVAKTVYGILKKTDDTDSLVGGITRLVKKAACDTTLENAYRDRAQYAWINNGDSCAFCLAIAANGWTNVSERMQKKGYKYAEHIHTNCDCNFAIRFNESTTIEGYDPHSAWEKINKAALDDGLLEEGETVETASGFRGKQFNNEIINAVRRFQYAQTHKGN